MPAIDIIVYTVAAITAVITFLVSLKALRQFSIFSSPVISVCVGLLTFIGMLQLDQECLSLLIPYQALGITLLVFFILWPFLRPKHGLQRRKPMTNCVDKTLSRNHIKKGRRKERRNHVHNNSDIRDTGMGL